MLHFALILLFSQPSPWAEDSSFELVNYVLYLQGLVGFKYDKIFVEKDRLKEMVDGDYKDSLLNRSALQILRSARNDLDRIEKIKRKDPLVAKIIANRKSFKDDFELFGNSNKDRQKEILKEKQQDYENLIGAFGGESYLAFIASKLYLILLESFYCLLDEKEKYSLGKDFLARCERDFKGKTWEQNLLYLQAISDAKCTLESLDPGSASVLDQEIDKLAEYNRKMFAKGQPELDVRFFKLASLSKKGEHPELIRAFREIPASWLEKENSKLLHIFGSLNLAAESFEKSGESELATKYRKAALDVFEAAGISRGPMVLKAAEELQRKYRDQMKWKEMRDLESRYVKMGLKPLPKQPGEN